MLKTKNNIFTNWSKDLYIATKLGVTYDDYNNEIVEYDTPFYFGKVNYEPLTNFELKEYIRAYGEEKNSVVCALIDYIDGDKIKTFDLAYLYGATPENEVVNGQNANFVVKSVRRQNTKISVFLEELTKEVN